jgi:hypothetical protein
MNLREQAFVKALVEPDRQERFLGFLADPQKRRKAQSLFGALHKLGASDKCWFDGGRFYGEERELLEAAIQDPGDGFVLSCIPGKLAYMKTGDDEYILRL